MKKLSIFAVLFLIVGCQSNKVVKNPEPLFTINNKEYTTNDVANLILDLDYGQYVVQNVEDKTIEMLIKEKNYDLNAKVEERVTELTDVAKSMGMDLETLVKSYGFASEEVFKQYLEKMVFIDTFAYESAEESYDDLLKKYEIKKLTFMTVEGEGDAKDIVKYVEDEFTIVEIEKEYKVLAKDTVLFHNKAEGFDEEFVKKIKGLSENKAFYEESSQDGVYIVAIYNNEPIDKQEALDTIVGETDFADNLFAQEVLNRGFKVKNKKLKENMKIDFSQYIK